MRLLISTWVLTIAALGGLGAWLWTAEIPEAEARVVSEPAEEQTTVVQTQPKTVTTGPIKVNIQNATEEDCLGTC